MKAAKLLHRYDNAINFRAAPSCDTRCSYMRHDALQAGFSRQVMLRALIAVAQKSLFAHHGCSVHFFDGGVQCLGKLEWKYCPDKRLRKSREENQNSWPCRVNLVHPIILMKDHCITETNEITSSGISSDPKSQCQRKSAERVSKACWLR